jgi:hypothetical protein
MKNLETWLQQQRDELPPGCDIAAVYCHGSDKVHIQITGPFYGSPYTATDPFDFEDALLKAQNKIRELQTRMRAS